MATKLTPKQARFVDEYLIDLNAAQAAIRAGYSSRAAKEIGCENLTKANVKEAIEKRMQSKNKKTIATQDEVLELLTSMARGEIEEEVLAYDSDMGTHITGKKQITPNDRIKAITLLAKRYGLDKQVIEITDKTVQVVDDI